MRAYSVPFTRIDQDEDFRQLAKETRGFPDDNNNTIRWRGGMARGIVRKWHLDTGLHMRVWDLVLSENVELTKPAQPLYVPNPGFHLICILSPDSVALKSVNDHQQVSRMRERNMVFTPDNINTTLQLSANLPVQIIDFQISPYWLRNLPAFANVAKYFDEQAAEENDLPVLIEPCMRRNYLTAGKLLNAAGSGNMNTGELYSLASFLISDFLEKVAGNGVDKASGNVSMYYEKVMEVETILINYLQSSLPRLGSVAQRVALSESTLKRYFKQVFGKSIYEYYLIKKMEMARKLMMEKPMTVNEAAELMGYEKVSNFIDIFKKHHGYSPGTIRKKNGFMQDSGSRGSFLA